MIAPRKVKFEAKKKENENSECMRMENPMKNGRKRKRKKEISSHGSRINCIKVILIEFCLNKNLFE